MARKEEALSWAFPAFLATQEGATDIYPTGLPRDIPYCFQTFSIPNDFQNNFSQLSSGPAFPPILPGPTF